jgi:ATP-binding cassette subfamily B multidrug efflux pump
MNMRTRLLSYLRPEKKIMVLSGISVLIFLVAQLMIPYLVGLSINALGAFDASGVYQVNVDTHRILVYLLIALGLALIGLVFDFFFEYGVGLLTQHAVRAIRDDVFRKFNSVPIRTIDQERHGNLVQMEIGDVENIANGIYSVFKQLVQGVLAILITIILMFTVNWILALGVILLTPLSFFMSRFVAQFSHKYFKKQAALQGELNTISLESISNFETLQSLNAEKSFEENFGKRDEVLRNQGRIAQFSASWTNPSTRLVNNTIYAIIGISGIVMIFYTASYPILGMTIGALSSFLSYTTQYTKPFNEISAVLSEYETAQFSFRRISDFLSEADDTDDGKTLLTGKIEEISFNDMTFSYEPSQHLIEHFSQKIHQGEKVAIVGPTGAGKTTLINVLMRFYDPTGGTITYDGIPGTEIPKKDLRKNFGMVLQDTWIFSGTVLENVRYAKPTASDEEVKEACRSANADSFIQTLPEGYDTVLSAKGGLSEGERQLLTIARVMLAKPDIVILDEATSNVDTRTEKKIGEAFDKMMKGRTSIVIAHRLSTIQEADLILVLRNGGIVEQGNHEELMAKKGFYYDLYTSQFR